MAILRDENDEISGPEIRRFVFAKSDRVFESGESISKNNVTKQNTTEKTSESVLNMYI